VVHLGDSSVESNDFVPVVSGVENQVLAHHGQADQTEISSGFIVSWMYLIRGSVAAQVDAIKACAED
jgi:hypothetical protein